MLGFGRFGRARQEIRRLLGAVGAALLLFVQAFSAAYVIAEADHDCCGAGCQTCVMLQQSVANFQLTGSGLEADATAVPLPIVAADRIVPVVVVPPCRSLVAQKVQFNE